MVEGRNLIREAGRKNAAWTIGEIGQKTGLPQWCAFYAATGFCIRTEKRIDHLAPIPNAQMQMRKFGLARKPDDPQMAVDGLRDRPFAPGCCPDACGNTGCANRRHGRQEPRCRTHGPSTGLGHIRRAYGRERHFACQSLAPAQPPKRGCCGQANLRREVESPYPCGHRRQAGCRYNPWLRVRDPGQRSFGWYRRTRIYNPPAATGESLVPRQMLYGT